MARPVRDTTGPAAMMPAPEAPLMKLLRRGVLARHECQDRGCRQTTTARCSYVDRHGEPCPTWWCAKHVHGVGHKPFCGAHAVSVGVADLGDHRVGRGLQWLGAAVDDDIIATLRPAAERTGENVMAEAVRFATVGLERSRLWERTWKTYSEYGVGCRVSLAIADRDGDVVQVRVNSTTVTTVAMPWELTGTNPRSHSDSFIPKVIVPAKIAIDVWLQSAIVHLPGAPRRGS